MSESEMKSKVMVGGRGLEKGHAPFDVASEKLRVGARMLQGALRDGKLYRREVFAEAEALQPPNPNFTYYRAARPDPTQPPGSFPPISRQFQPPRTVGGLQIQYIGWYSVGRWRSLSVRPTSRWLLPTAPYYYKIELPPSINIQYIKTNTKKN